jgi:hypothetical protein
MPSIITLALSSVAPLVAPVVALAVPVLVSEIPDQTLPEDTSETIQDLSTNPDATAIIFNTFAPVIPDIPLPDSTDFWC